MLASANKKSSGRIKPFPACLGAPAGDMDGLLCKREVAHTKLGHVQAWLRATLGMLSVIG